MNKKFVAIGAVGILTLSGCVNDNQKSLSEPVTNRYLTNMIVFTEPDGFRNITVGCNGTTAIYVTSRGAWKNSGTDVASLPSGVAVLANDPYCTGQRVGGTNQQPTNVTIP